jgi:hypothetical protein
MEWKFEEQFMMAEWDKWRRWILERRGSLPRDRFENFLEEVIDLKAKHDELAELVAWWKDCNETMDYIDCWDFLKPRQIWVNAFKEATVCLRDAETALRKAVEV